MRAHRLFIVVVLSVLAAVACDDASPPPDSGTVELRGDQGIDFATGATRAPGNFSNSDLYASANGDSGMKLVTGGASPIDNRPITWFRSGGGLPTEFTDLASVPSAPEPTTYEALLHAKTGHGFLLKTKAGDLVRGFVASASATSVTIAWARVGAE